MPESLAAEAVKMLPLPIATVNAGKMSVAGIDLVIDAGAEAICFQEMGDREDIKRHLGKKGWNLLQGTGKPGQASTPVAFDPEAFELVHEVAILLRKSRFWGIGTGPDTGKAKWLIGGVFKHLATGRYVLIVSAHLPPSQSKILRRRAAVAMTKKIDAELGHYGCLVFVGMDANTETGKPGIAPMEDHGWDWSQRVEPTKTHGNWKPDGVWWHKSNLNRMRYRTTITVRTGSDHMGVIVVFLVLPRHHAHP